MHVLNTLEILHENPYTGDKITKASIVQIEPSLLSNAHNRSKEQKCSQESGNHNHNNVTETTTTESEGIRALKRDNNIKAAPVEGGSQGALASSPSPPPPPSPSPPSLPQLVAIKFLSDYRTIHPKRDKDRDGLGSSASEEWDSDDESNCEDPFDGDYSHLQTPKSCESRQQQQRQWPFVGESTLPPGIKFGIKAKREIRALRAAQGHPSVIPFLGFTGLPIQNPFKPSKTSKSKYNNNDNDNDNDAFSAQESYQGGPLSIPAALSPPSVAQEMSSITNNKYDNVDLVNKGLGASLFGQAPLGRSLFQEQGNDLLSSPGQVQSMTPSGLFPPFRNSGFNSDYDSDIYSSDDDHDYDNIKTGNTDPNTLSRNDGVAAAQKRWNRLFTRQPRMGGLLLPYLPITMEDLIQIGWTKSRPLLVETCMRQILEGLAWVHDEAGLIHRDISASNIMVAIHPTDNNINKYEGEQALQGSEVGIIQCLISDFGCATFQNPKETMGKDREEPFDNQQECRRHQEKENIEYDQQRLTFEVGTRAYRAPELLFSSENYTNTIDIWSAGVLFAGMFLGRRLFEAESDIGQVCAIVKVLGTPTEENWPEYPTMPDYGKLMFQALETNPLSSILLPTGPTSEAPQHKDSSSSHNYLDKEGVSVAKCSSSPATISDTAFKLIESMITYSGSARPSARRALAFKDHYLERTKQLEPGHERQSAHGDQMEQTKMRKDFLEQCIIHEQTILEEMQRLRARQAEEEEEEGGYDGFMFGGPRRPPERPSDDEAGSEGEGEEEGGGDGYRSDDLSGEAVAGLRQQGEIRHLMPGFEVEGAYGFEEYSGDSAALTTAGSPRSIKRHRASSGEE